MSRDGWEDRLVGWLVGGCGEIKKEKTGYTEHQGGLSPKAVESGNCTRKPCFREMLSTYVLSEDGETKVWEAQRQLHLHGQRGKGALDGERELEWRVKAHQRYTEVMTNGLKKDAPLKERQGRLLGPGRTVVLSVLGWRLTWGKGWRPLIESSKDEAFDRIILEQGFRYRSWWSLICSLDSVILIFSLSLELSSSTLNIFILLAKILPKFFFSSSVLFFFF